jgi:hypothetical protein
MFLNSLHPGWYFQELGVVHFSMDKFDSVIVAFERNGELGPYDLAFIAACQVANNQLTEAKANCARALALQLQLELELEFNLSGKLFAQFETFQNINNANC